jgi:hypothetical protein
MREREGDEHRVLEQRGEVEVFAVEGLAREGADDGEIGVVAFEACEQPSCSVIPSTSESETAGHSEAKVAMARGSRTAVAVVNAPMRRRPV